MGHDGLCCTGESGPQLKDELIRRGFNPIRVRTVWDCFGHSGTGIVEFNRDWNGLNDALLFKKAYQEDGHGKKDWLSGGTDSSLYAWLANADDYYRANYIGEYLRKMGDLKSVSRFAEEEARKDRKLVQRLNLISENIQNQLRKLEEKFSKTSITLKYETEEKDKILHGYSQGDLFPLLLLHSASYVYCFFLHFLFLHVKISREDNKDRLITLTESLLIMKSKRRSWRLR